MTAIESGAADAFTLDSNIFIYSVDENAGSRRDTARRTIELAIAHGGCVLVLQSMGEFYSVATRKGFVSPAGAAERVTVWLRLFLKVLPTTVDAMRIALNAATTRRLSFWDALLLATASAGGCTMILTEDMADGTTVQGMRIVNPFGPNGGLSPAALQLLA